VSQKLIARLRQRLKGSIHEEAADALERQGKETLILKNALVLIWQKSTDDFAVDEARKAIEAINA
jgi:hypothetical protein